MCAFWGNCSFKIDFYINDRRHDNLYVHSVLSVYTLEFLFQTILRTILKNRLCKMQTSYIAAKSTICDQHTYYTKPLRIYSMNSGYMPEQTFYNLSSD